MIDFIFRFQAQQLHFRSLWLYASLVSTSSALVIIRHKRGALKTPPMSLQRPIFRPYFNLIKVERTIFTMFKLIFFLDFLFKLYIQYISTNLLIKSFSNRQFCLAHIFLFYLRELSCNIEQVHIKYYFFTLFLNNSKKMNKLIPICRTAFLRANLKTSCRFLASKSTFLLSPLTQPTSGLTAPRISQIRFYVASKKSSKGKNTDVIRYRSY